jgi:hypothetical protein
MGGPGGAASSGYVCETIDHAGGTTFWTSNEFSQLTLEIYINGLRQIGGFTPDGNLGTFTLDYPIAANDFLRVCYTATA